MDPNPPRLFPALQLRDPATPLNEHVVVSCLTTEGVPPALVPAFLSTLRQTPLRFLILDDSGSMNEGDGCRLRRLANEQCRMEPCTRWAELTSNARFYIQLAEVARAPCEVRLLNSLAPVRIGMGERAAEKVGVSQLVACLDQSPSSGTPLCRHVREVIEELSSVQEQLRARGQKAVLIIATDGEASDGDLASAMKPLEKLPVRVIVRLCTNNSSVVSYWNAIDSQLELDMDVLDDLVGEATEICAKNPWLVYSDSLQHLRTLGTTLRELDLIDERRLTPEQLHALACILLDVHLPSPAAGWPAFSAAVRGAIAQTARVICPRTLSFRPCIDADVMDRTYHTLSGAPPLSEGLLDDLRQGISRAATKYAPQVQQAVHSAPEVWWFGAIILLALLIKALGLL
eukprot:m.21364 g.21364  ORF g.21364 m.21364 type:complete len:401 (+) comp3618_c0_seq1:142-1344(+)